MRLSITFRRDNRTIEMLIGVDRVEKEISIILDYINEVEGLLDLIEDTNIHIDDIKIVNETVKSIKYDGDFLRQEIRRGR